MWCSDLGKGLLVFLVPEGCAGELVSQDFWFGHHSSVTDLRQVPSFSLPSVSFQIRKDTAVEGDTVKQRCFPVLFIKRQIGMDASAEHTAKSTESGSNICNAH